MRKIDTPPGYNLVPKDCIVATAEQRRALSIGEEDAGKLILQKDTNRMYLATLTEGAKDLTASHAAEHAEMGAPYTLRFPGFVRSLLASLVVSATAARTSNVVTVTATGHGITTGATYVGFNFFYPGSPSLAAGWYGPILSVPDANTITFTAAGANFGSETVNGGAIYTSLTDVASLVIPAAYMIADANISVIGYSGGDTTASTKQVRTYLAGNNVHTHGTTTTPFVRFQATAVLLETGKAVGHSGFDNLSSSTEYLQNCPLGVDTTFLVKASLSAGSSFITINSLRALIT